VGEEWERSQGCERLCRAQHLAFTWGGRLKRSRRITLMEPSPSNDLASNGRISYTNSFNGTAGHFHSRPSTTRIKAQSFLHPEVSNRCTQRSSWLCCCAWSGRCLSRETKCAHIARCPTPCHCGCGCHDPESLQSRRTDKVLSGFQ
jgi:hypothetical protein